MNRRKFLSNLPISVTGLLASLKVWGTPTEGNTSLTAEDVPLEEDPPELTLVGFCEPLGHPHFITAQYARYYTEIGRIVPYPCRILASHHLLRGLTTSQARTAAIHKHRLEMLQTNMNSFITFTGPLPKVPSSMFPQEWLLHADNAVVIDWTGVRVVKDRNDRLRDVVWATESETAKV